jgi:O-antigen ligase
MGSSINKHLYFVFLCLFVVALIYSKFLLSVSMIGFVVFGLFEWRVRPFSVSLKNDLRAELKSFASTPAFVLLSLPVLAYLISGVNSADLGEWFWRVRTKSPFLFMPLAFFLMPKLDKTSYKAFWSWLLGVAVLSLAIVLLPFIYDQQSMVDLIYVGKTVPTPCHHIRYSMILVIAVLGGLHLLRSLKGLRKNLVILGISFLFIGLHLLAVRTGIVLLYLGIFSWVILALRGMWRWLAVGVSLFGMVLIPMLAFQFSPTFKQKMDYVKYDWEQYQKGHGATYSDSERWLSLEAGHRLWKDHPILGVGIGDLKSEMQVAFKEMGAEVSRKKFPHNQFLFVLAGCGLLGAMIFFGGFLTPLVLHHPGRHELLWSVYILLTASFMVENTVETAVGTAVTIGFIVILLKQSKDGVD